MNEIIFVIDPMCSWCWGFHPVIETLREKYKDQYIFSIVTGGLRSSGQEPWNEETKIYLKTHWENVAQRTGQPFSYALLNRTFFDYNTYPACKAIVTVRELWGQKAAFDYLSKIQYAFYAESKDITSIEVLTSYIEENKKVFKDFYTSDQAEVLMVQDFEKARAMGANAFPSVVKRDKEGQMVCLKGYRSAEEILAV
jgi:putative protein-disulfide isomerase